MDSDYETLEARVAALSEDQRRWLARKLEASAPRASTAEPKPPARGLVAYYAPGEGARIETDTLRAFLADRLPDYMIPATFMALERLPRTEGGKLDRDALPVPIEEHARPESIESGTPRNEIEETLVRIWQEVLGVEEVSIHDDFLEIGGDSLLSIRVLARARRVDIEISPEVFFEKPTIAALSERLDRDAEGRVGRPAHADSGVVLREHPGSPRALEPVVAALARRGPRRRRTSRSDRRIGGAACGVEDAFRTDGERPPAGLRAAPRPDTHRDRDGRIARRGGHARVRA
jgi:aryl carrier-like protein